MSTLNKLGIGVFVLLLLGCAHSSQQQAQQINHVVLIWLKPEYQTQASIEELKNKTLELKNIPGIKNLKVGTAIPSSRPIVDDSFDLGVLMTFTSEQSMQNYLTTPEHVKFVSDYVQGRIDKIKVYDF